MGKGLSERILSTASAAVERGNDKARKGSEHAIAPPEIGNEIGKEERKKAGPGNEKETNASRTNDLPSSAIESYSQPPLSPSPPPPVRPVAELQAPPALVTSPLRRLVSRKWSVDGVKWKPNSNAAGEGGGGTEARGGQRSDSIWSTFVEYFVDNKAKPPPPPFSGAKPSTASGQNECDRLVWDSGRGGQTGPRSTWETGGNDGTEGSEMLSSPESDPRDAEEMLQEPVKAGSVTGQNFLKHVQERYGKLLRRVFSVSVRRG